MATEREVVAIVGSCGQIGTALAERLGKKYTVVGFDKVGAIREPAHMRCIDFDITSDLSVRNWRWGGRCGRSTATYRIASVIHLGTYFDFRGESSDHYKAINVAGTGRLIGELHDFRVEQFVLASTMMVHRPDRPRRADHRELAADPRWGYPESMVWAENLVRAERDDIPVVMMRMAGTYDDWCHSPPLANQIQSIYERTLLSHLHPANTARGRGARPPGRPGGGVPQGGPAAAPTAAGDGPAGRRTRDDELRRAAGDARPVDPRGGMVHVPGAEGGGQGRGVGPGPLPVRAGRGGQAVDDRPGQRALRAGHHPGPHPAGVEPRHSLRAAVRTMVESLKNDPARWYRANTLELPPDMVAPTAPTRRVGARVMMHGRGAASGPLSPGFAGERVGVRGNREGVGRLLESCSPLTRPQSRPTSPPQSRGRGEGGCKPP